MLGIVLAGMYAGGTCGSPGLLRGREAKGRPRGPRGCQKLGLKGRDILRVRRCMRTRPQQAFIRCWRQPPGCSRATPPAGGLPCTATYRPRTAHVPPPQQEGIHPLLAAALPSDALGGLEAQSDLAQIAEKLKSYRPSQTVFEAEVAAARKGSGAGAPGGGRGCQRGRLPGGLRGARCSARRPEGGADGRGLGAGAEACLWGPGGSGTPEQLARRRGLGPRKSERASRPAFAPAGIMSLPGLVAAAPYERRLEVMKQKRQAHAAAIAAAKARSEGRGQLAGAGADDVTAGVAGGDEQQPREGGSDGEEEEGMDGDGEQRGAAGSGSDEEQAQRQQLGAGAGGGGGGRKRKRQFVLNVEPQSG